MLKRNISPGFLDGVKIGNELWCVSAYLDGLWRYDLISNESEKVLDLPQLFRHESFGIASEILNYENCVILLSIDLKIIIYNTKNSSLKTVDIKEFTEYEGEISLPGGAIIWNDELIIYPGVLSKSKANIYVYNLKSGHIKVIPLIDGCQSGQYLIFEDGYQLTDDKIYFIISQFGIIAVLNLNELSIKKIKYDIGDSVCSFSNIGIWNENIYLIPEKDRKIICLESDGEILETLNYPEGYEREKYRTIVGVVKHNDTLLLIPSYGNMCLQIEKGILKKNVAISNLMKDISENNSSYIYKLFFKKTKLYGEKLYLFSPWANAIYMYDFITEKIREYKCKVEVNSTDIVFAKMVTETGSINLETFIARECAI